MPDLRLMAVDPELGRGSLSSCTFSSTASSDKSALDTEVMLMFLEKLVM